MIDDRDEQRGRAEYAARKIMREIASLASGEAIQMIADTIMDAAAIVRAKTRGERLANQFIESVVVSSSATRVILNDLPGQSFTTVDFGDERIGDQRAAVVLVRIIREYLAKLIDSEIDRCRREQPGLTPASVE